MADQINKDLYSKNRTNAICDASQLDAGFRILQVPDLGHQWALGRPGYVLGRIKLIAGMEGASKSSSLYYDCNLAIEQGGLAAIVAMEEADSTSHIKAYVRRYPELVIWNARTLEEGIEMSLKVQKMFHEVDPEGLLPKVQGFDSIAGATEEDMAVDFDTDPDDDVEDQAHSRVGGIAKTMKTFFNTMKSAAAQTNTLWVVLNQAREQIYTGNDATYMMRKSLRDRLALTGGRAQRFAASYFEFHQKGRTAKEVSDFDDDIKISTGFDVEIDWIKNKPRIPDRKISRRIAYGRTFDYVPHTMPMIAANRICGMQVKLKRYWCEAVGVTEDHKVEGHIMYDLIHQPEHIWKFQRELDILGATMPPETQAPASVGSNAVPPPTQPSAEVMSDVAKSK